ncbi:MAG: tetratricopeptide repeat protein [Cyanobacteria bacterium]|nr:tetratricopeptide repeat protein [Cyanobacteriota bacterium]
MAPRWLRSLVALPLVMGVGLGSTPAAQALVPYVVLPVQQDLEAAGLGIAQAAARLLRLGQAEEAARLAALTVQLVPNDPRGWILLAEAQLRSKQPKLAAMALGQAKRLDPKNPGIWFAEGSLALHDNQPQRAIQLLEQGLKLDGKNPGAYFDLGNAQIMLAKLRPALAAFEKAASLRPNFWEAINNQALVLFELGKPAEAISRWRQVLRIKADAAEPSLALAAALNGLKPGNQEAIELANRALAAEPNYVLESYQKDQLWGPRLRAATHRLVHRNELKASLERAQANAGGSVDGQDDQ